MSGAHKEIERRSNAEPLYLTPEEFKDSFRNVPRLAVNLIITNENGEVLLVRRNIPPQKGSWHMPGGFLLKNETIKAARARIANKELGLDLPEDDEVKLLGAFEDIDGDPRGHVIDLAFGMRLISKQEIGQTAENAKARFFSVLPDKIGFNHRNTLHLLGYIDE